MPARRNCHLSLALIGILSLIMAFRRPANAEAVLTPVLAGTPATPLKVPLSHLYSHFFLYEAHLEHFDEAHPLKSPKEKPIKERLRLKTGLTEAEWKTVSTHSLQMEATRRDIETHVHALQEADRAACRMSPGICAAPPSAPQIKTLNTQRQQTVDDHIATVESSLGPHSTAKLRAYLQGDFANHIKVTALSPAQMQAIKQAGQAVSK